MITFILSHFLRKILFRILFTIDTNCESFCVFEGTDDSFQHMRLKMSIILCELVEIVDDIPRAKKKN